MNRRYQQSKRKLLKLSKWVTECKQRFGEADFRTIDAKSAYERYRLNFQTRFGTL